MNISTRSSIKLVCFDVGGVLIRTCRTFLEGVTTAGLPLRASPLEIAALYDSALDVRDKYRTGQIASDTYARCVSQAFRGLYTKSEVLQVLDASIKDTYPDTEEILRALNGFVGIEVALLTNTNFEHWSRVVILPWMKYVRYSFASHELGVAKPSPAVFKTVESVTRTVPADILYFDDTERNIAVSNQLYWRSVLITSSEKPGAQIRRELSQCGIVL